MQPLDRFGSIQQPLFRHFYEKLVTGSWCHIFPEGRIYQNWRFDNATADGKGGNLAPARQVLGPLRVGVGKLIAHSIASRRMNLGEGKCPLVLPLYHRGMDRVLPERKLPLESLYRLKRANNSLQLFPREEYDRENVKLGSTAEHLGVGTVTDENQLVQSARRKRRHQPKISKPVSASPMGGNSIMVIIGEPLDFTEEIQNFCDAYPYQLDSWECSLPKIELYERITLRIEQSLLELEAQAYERV